MARIGQSAKELLLELAQTELRTIPPYQQERVQRVLQEVQEHHQEMTRVIREAEDKARRLQGLPDNASIVLPWSRFPQDYTAMMTHMTCIERYKRCLLAYSMARLERIKHILWCKHQLPHQVRDNLSPYEIDFARQYQQNLKQYAKSCSMGMDLTMDEAPPKSTCVQVRVVRDHGDMMSKTGKIMLSKDTVHLLPLDEAEHLLRAGIVEYLHVGVTM